MKRMMIFLLSALLLMTAGCSHQPEATEPQTIPITEVPTESPAEESTEAPTEPVPTTVNVEVQVDNAPPILVLLNRGDIVDVVGEYGEDYYVIKTEQGYGLVEKQLLRMDGTESYEVWKGYTYHNAQVYGNYQFIGEPVLTLSQNTQIEVLDELKYGYVVLVNEAEGFIKKEEVSKNRIQYSGGGNSGGADGGDISLNANGGGSVVFLSMIEQSGDVTGQAEVLADGTQVILGFFDRGEMAPLVAEEGFTPVWEGHHTLYLNGMYAYLPCNLALMTDEEPYTQWEGFAGYNACIHDNYLLLGEGTKLNVNASMTVLWDGGDFLVVEIDGSIGYIDTENVGTSRFATGGGGNSGGDWTPPAL